VIISEYPAVLNSSDATPLKGFCFRSAITSDGQVRYVPIYREHEGNRSIHLGDWKFAGEVNTEWELLSMSEDRRN
jgi:hypothetical protein